MYDHQRFHPIHQKYQPSYRSNPLFTMTVNGEGHITARPNQAKLTLGVVTEHTSAQAAQQENAEISNRVIKALKQIGIRSEERRVGKECRSWRARCGRTRKRKEH